MNNRQFLSSLTGVFITFSCLSNGNTQAANTTISTRVFTNTSTNMDALKVDIALPVPTDPDNQYTWVEIQNLTSTPKKDVVKIPAGSIPGRGGTIIDFMTTPQVMILAPLNNGKMSVTTSSLVKDSPLPASKVTFKKLDGTVISIDSKPETPKATLKKVGAHNSTTDGFGGSSEFAMVLSNSSTGSIAIDDFRLFQNVEMDPLLSALESPMRPEDLLRDPINTIGTGELVDNVMSSFVLNPGDEFAFHFGSNFDPSMIGISSGLCNGDFECSDSAMAIVPEPNNILGLLTISGIALGTSKKKQG